MKNNLIAVLAGLMLVSTSPFAAAAPARSHNDHRVEAVFVLPINGKDFFLIAHSASREFVKDWVYQDESGLNHTVLPANIVDEGVSLPQFVAGLIDTTMRYSFHKSMYALTDENPDNPLYAQMRAKYPRPSESEPVIAALKRIIARQAREN